MLYKSISKSGKTLEKTIYYVSQVGKASWGDNTFIAVIMMYGVLPDEILIICLGFKDHPQISSEEAEKK